MSRATTAGRIVRGGASGSRARMGLVLLHGRGGTGADILPLGEALGLPELALAAPEHPARSWWPTSFLAPQDQMAAPIAEGLALVEAAIADLEAEGLERSQIAVAGFSQGGCLALEYAARSGTGLAGAFGLSGALVGTGDAPGGPDEDLFGFGPKRFDYDTDLSGMPVYLSVHAVDPHIPLARSQASARVFQHLGAQVDLNIADGQGHGLLPDDLSALRKVLNRLPA